MRSKYLIASTIAAGSLAVAGAGVGTSLAASPAAAQHTLTFKSKTVAGHSLGKYSFADADKDIAHGKFIGTDAVRGTFNPKTHTASGKVAAALRGGFLYAQFSIAKNNDIAGKVTGGTGQFAGATGTITGTQPKKNVEKVTITYK
jgi:hypothetical protein